MKNKTTLVSVIVPTYGRPEFLELAIKSILKQTYQNIEIIIIDDNKDYNVHVETLNLVNKLKSLNSKFEIIYFFDGNNRGGALARNKGIELSRGEYITFLDDDDIYLSDKVEKQVYHIIHNELDVSVCDMLFNKKGKFLDVSNCYARVNNFNDFILNGNAYTPMIMCKKIALLDVKGFTDSPRYQDHILMIKLFEKGKKISHLKEKLFIHNDHNNPRVTFSKNSELAYKIRTSYEKRNLSRLSDIQIKKYYLNNFLIESKLYRANNNYFKSLKFIFKSFLKITSFNDVFKILKTIIRIHLYPQKNI
ncbi:glycosyltransferase family 2 protein [Providencia stuartii]|uniref:glycosyltransferase family 2 protein n=1 Tax=Providencia stuartii TaxID=588 RepID=UPI0023B1FDD0|nr:glycosyltransferase family 2 protein [Providencia thailandensis]MDE8748236.1 glycosyltransferase family 2 protein [Providencia thailandensis]MDE8767613.1 glycosyltransferase family 2 protein [Providencia thailandensis]MDE8779980.1 glycosyltransferase family 2 protein [Providencia thailandensis]MDE8783940.1 glycosyltransferase family 2 protein [Providencia thailandensis]MDE8788044.1 glycosyltransferase family 2 protein [Providencia thailandensis]